MADKFTTDYERQRDQRLRSMNPCPGRTDSERKYIARCLSQINDVLQYWLDETEGSTPNWLHEFVITPELELRYVDTLEEYKTLERDADGYMHELHDSNRKATNRIRVATWYKNNTGDLYMIPMIIVSPLPCDEWGAVPLSLAHWRIIVNAMTEAHMRWSWVHAVRDHWQDHTWLPGGAFGWHMEKCKKLQKDSGNLCTGQAIYSHVLIKYLNKAT